MIASMILSIGILSITRDGNAPEPAITLRLDRPDQQLETLIHLFDGAPTSDPASTLAAWKQAPGGPRGLGKPIEAALAALNPSMVRELRSFHDAEARINFNPVRWSIHAPHDDGLLAAVAPALSLTGGETEPAIDSARVDRLGPIGGPVMARSERGVVLAGNRESLQNALKVPVKPDSAGPGIGMRFLPGQIELAPNPIAKRVAAGLAGLGLQEIRGRLTLEADEIHLTLDGRGRFPALTASIVPEWLDSLPDSDGVIFALGFNPDPHAWDAWFAAADRVEKIDPAKRLAAPLRTRLNLAATLAGISFETAIRGHLRGISGFVAFEPGDRGRIDRAVLRIHFDDEPAARKLLQSIAVPDQIGGKPLRKSLNSAALALIWGGNPPAETRNGPQHSIRRYFSKAEMPSRFVATWPGRLGLIAAETPLERTLESSPPAIWQGWDHADATHDDLRWDALKPTLRRFLDALPLAP